MKVNKVSKLVKLSSTEIIKFQLITYCFINKINLSDADINCLVILGELEEIPLGDFCKDISIKNIFKSSQTVRNTISKCQKLGLISKLGKNNKKISLNSELKIQTKGNILLEYKLYSVVEEPKLEPTIESKESQLIY